jgi:hypothetical protein
MHWTDIMHLTEIMPQTATERATAGADLLGVVMTTVWLAGTNMEDVNTVLHTAIAGVTLASVSFSLTLKIRDHFKPKP